MNRSAVLAFAIHSAAALVLGVAGVAKLLQPYFAAVHCLIGHCYRALVLPMLSC